jgi:predicted ABC-type ATPase
MLNKTFTLIFKLLLGGTLMASSAIPKVCNTDTIYEGDGGFNYSLPKGILDSYLSGKAFDHPREYSLAERTALELDIENLFVRMMEVNPTRERIAVITAGAPGAGKTTLMEQDLRAQEARFGYIDPDAVCLKTEMPASYLKELDEAMAAIETAEYPSESAKLDAQKQARLDLYTKWRPGSNAAAQIILANLIKEHVGVYFGTTASAPATGFLLKFLKDHGYEIRILHVTAPDDVRVASIKERDKVFVQTTDRDIVIKGLDFPQRIEDVYKKYADSIEFYYRDRVDSDAKLVALWNTDLFMIADESGYAAAKAVHDAVLERVNRSELMWKHTLEGEIY